MEPAGASDAVFLFCMLPGIAGILLMLAVRKRKSSGQAGRDVAMGF